VFEKGNMVGKCENVVLSIAYTNNDLFSDFVSMFVSQLLMVQKSSNTIKLLVQVHSDF